jgi:biopolymer transport protein ExbD
MRLKYRPKPPITLDLTPMIDVTFQLIAFFMFLMNFSQIERAEEIMLPTSAVAVPPRELPAYQIILNLVEDGSVIHDGQRIEKIEFITSLLRREIGAAARQDVGNPGDISVVLRAHQDTPTGQVQELIKKCQESELETFSLRVKEKK